MSLCDIAVNPYTASELVRLCLRRQDVEDQSTSNLSAETDLEEEVVSVAMVTSPALPSIGVCYQ